MLLPLRLLSQRDALDLVLQAHEDLPGMNFFLQPVIAPRPLTDDLVIQGYVLHISGVRGRGPWFEVRDTLAYNAVYEQILEHYEAQKAVVRPAPRKRIPAPIVPLRPVEDAEGAGEEETFQEALK
jgi:hypothetical protein